MSRRLYATILFAGLAGASVTVAGPATASTAGSGATPVSSEPASTSAGATSVRLTAAQQRALEADYASYRQVPTADIGRIIAGSAKAARVTDGGREWAKIAFVPSAKDSTALAAGFQDGAGTGIFTRASGKSWTVAGVGGEPIGCDTRLPSSVRALWKLGSCPASSRMDLQAAESALPAADTMQDLADIALDQVGIGDTPASDNFNDDCNPYTAMVVGDISSSGCGTDPTFGVLDENELWCADLTKWVWEEAGAGDLSVLDPAAASFYTWGADHGESMPTDPTDPKVGDAVVFYPPGSAPNGNYADHVGIVASVNSDGTVNLVDGDFGGDGVDITVQYNTDVSLASWSSAVWNTGEQWIFVSPELSS